MKRRKSPERTKTSKATTRPDRLIELAEAIKEAVEGGRCVDWSAVDGGRLAKGRDAPTRAVVDWCIEEARRRFARLAQAYADCHLNCDLTEDEDLRLSDAILVFQVKREPVLPCPAAETRAFNKGLKDLAWRFKYRARQEAEKMRGEARAKAQARKRTGKKNLGHSESLKTWLRETRPTWVEQRRSKGKGFSWAAFREAHQEELTRRAKEKNWTETTPATLRAAYESARHR